MKVGVAYATAKRQAWLTAELSEEATVKDAIERSGILKQFPDLDLATHKVGIFGKITTLDARVVDGDRVEIYNPLTVDPKTVKRKAKADDGAAADA